jgi:hypothetical protein
MGKKYYSPFVSTFEGFSKIGMESTFFYFETFDIESIPHFQNVSIDILANATSRYMPLSDGFSVEIMFRPSIPNDVMNWRVFN